MTSEEKVALLLHSLGSEVADRVLALLEPAQGQRLRVQMQSWAARPEAPDVLDQVMKECEVMMQAALQEKRGGQQPPTPAPTQEQPSAEEGSNQAKDSSSAAGAAETKPPKPPKPPALDLEKIDDPVAALRLLNPERLAMALVGEKSRTVVLILNQLEAQRAGEVLRRLPPDFRREISVILDKSIPVGQEVLQRIALAILKKSQLLADLPADAGAKAHYKKLADMLRYLDKADRLEMLAALEENNPEAAMAIKEFLYQFEDLLLIEDRSMQKLLSEVDSKTLALALKNAPDKIKDKVMNNLSKRAREALNEEIEFLGPTSALQVQQAEKTIVETIQRLDQAGELVMTQ